MSTLQISLAIIGGLVLAAVVAYNAWIARKSAPRTASERGHDSRFHATSRFEDTASPADGNLQEGVSGRIDPVLGDGFEGMSGGEGMADEGHQAPSRGGPVTLNQMVNPADKKAGLDALIDVIIPLQLENAVLGESLLGALPGTRRVGSKPFAVEGQTPTGEWETPRTGQRYRTLQAGVQLANRSGALNDIEFSEFVVKVQAFADAVGASPDFPDMRAEVARARELDAFASAHDAQLGFTLRARSAAWSPGYVAQHAYRLGFLAGSLPGRMVLPGSQGHAPILSLTFDPQAAMADDPEQSALRDIALALEVTHVPRSEQPFVRLR
ncbi:MAG: cell division protein FtsZ, partial [Hydrogenophaga sp.]|nr:cell division protein FtsZ [Hydrogenophaga sp.]